MKSLSMLAAAVAALATLTRVPMASAITDGEAGYINDMTNAGMGPPVSVPMFLNQAYQVCADLRGGNNAVFETSLVRQHDTGLTVHQSDQLVGLAIKNLCPDQIDKVHS